MPNRLSARQIECLKLTRLMSDKEIARHLNISESTVKKHVFEACQRFGVNRRKAALAELERLVPGATSHPIPSAVAAVLHEPVETGECHEQLQPTSAVDVDRSRRSDGSSYQGAGSGCREAAPIAGPSRRRPTDESGGAFEGTDGRSASATATKYGYKPPPESVFTRLILIVVSMALTALIFSAISSVVVQDQHRIQFAVN